MTRMTFGELVTQIKKGLIGLCDDLLNPGAAQSLGPAHAYGKSFLIFQSVRTLQEAIQKQENYLKELAGKEGNLGPAQSNDTRLRRLVNSIYLSISLINRYDPARFAHQGITEWFEQQATSCSLSSVFFTDEQRFHIFGHSFTLELQLTENQSLESVTLTYGKNENQQTVQLPEIVEMVNQGNQEHISHLLSMAARLDIIEVNEEQSLIAQTQSLANDPRYGFKLSLGGFRFPFIDGYEAVLTLDSYDQQKRIEPTIVIDPPIAFPLNQLKDISSARINIELSVSSFLSKALNLSTDIQRHVGDKTVKLNLNDDGVNTIMLARFPLPQLNSFETVVERLRTAATWCKIIHDAFQVNEEINDDNQHPYAIEISPCDDFTIGVNYWVQAGPDILIISINPDGTLTTDKPEINEALGGSTEQFGDIIMTLLQ